MIWLFFVDLSNMYSLLKPIHGGLSVLISEVEGHIKTSFTVILRHGYYLQIYPICIPCYSQFMVALEY